MKRQLFIAIILIFITASCDSGRTKIVDYYNVYDYVDFDYQGHPINAVDVLMCKLASKDDPFIENVTRVEWNDSAIIAFTDKGYFVIESNSYGLCCSCRNKTKGPLTEPELQKYKVEIGFEPENEKAIK